MAGPHFGAVFSLRWRLMPIEGSKAEQRFAPVILAGGSGTRFWPRSRRSRAKQVLALDGKRTMIQQTVDRLTPLVDPTDVWIITNNLLDDLIAEQLPEVPREHILSEPAARNTAPACALAAFLLEKTEPETVIGIFPSDHVVKNGARFAEVIRAGIALAASGDRIVVLGVPPTRAETGYGYIELGATVEPSRVARGEIAVRRVKRFTEKPNAERGGAVCRVRQLCMECRDISLERADAGERYSRDLSCDGAAAGKDRRGLSNVEGRV